MGCCRHRPAIDLVRKSSGSNSGGMRSTPFITSPRDRCAQIVTDYSAPNNHILYTLVLRPFYLLSSDALVLRLPSLAISVAVLLATFRLGLLTAGRSVAVWSTLALGLNIMFLVHTMQLRGYGLSMLLIVCLANIALSAHVCWRSGILITLFGAGLLYTIPTNALMLAPLTLWAGYTAWRCGARGLSLVKSLAPWCAAWILGILLYLPVANQLISRNGAGRPRAQQMVELVGKVAWAAGHDMWPLWLALPWLVLLWLRRRRCLRPKTDWAVASLVVAMLIGPFLATAVLRTVPFVRNFCPILPFLALGTGWLLDEAIRLNRSRSVNGANDNTTLIGAGVIVVLLLPAVLLYPARLRKLREERFVQDGYYNYYAADFEPSCSVRYLRERLDPAGTYLICYAASDHYNLIDPLARAGFSIPPYHVGGDGPRPGPVFLILPPRPRYDEIQRSCGLSEAEVARFPVVKRCGYYEVRQSPEPRMLAH